MTAIIDPRWTPSRHLLTDRRGVFVAVEVQVTVRFSRILFGVGEPLATARTLNDVFAVHQITASLAGDPRVVYVGRT